MFEELILESIRDGDVKALEAALKMDGLYKQAADDTATDLNDPATIATAERKIDGWRHSVDEAIDLYRSTIADGADRFAALGKVMSYLYLTNKGDALGLAMSFAVAIEKFADTPDGTYRKASKLSGFDADSVEPLPGYGHTV